MKTTYYTLSYLDRDNNEIERKTIEAKNKKDAKRISKIALANSNHNGLKKITVI